MSSTNIFFLFETYISAIAIAYDSSFKKDQYILVLPLDLLRFDTHEKLTQDVLKHFEKVMTFLVDRKITLIRDSDHFGDNMKQF